MEYNNFDENNLLKRYIVSFYYIIITISGVGYGDIFPNTIYEYLFVTILVIIAIGVFGYIIS